MHDRVDGVGRRHDIPALATMDQHVPRTPDVVMMENTD